MASVQNTITSTSSYSFADVAEKAVVVWDFAKNVTVKGSSYAKDIAIAVGSLTIVVLKQLAFYFSCYVSFASTQAKSFALTIGHFTKTQIIVNQLPLALLFSFLALGISIMRYTDSTPSKS